MLEIRPEAQSIINRLKAVDQTKPYELEKDKIYFAFCKHLTALNQPIRPIKWIMGCKTGYLAVLGAAWDAARDAAWDAARGAAWDAARDAAWDAARGAAWDAAWDAAWGAAWDAAIENSLFDHKELQNFRSVWMPFVDAFESGLFIYWMTKKEIIAIPRPLFRFKENLLHGDGVPGIEFPNGEKYYFWRGVKIPDGWGSISSEHWKTEWLIEEKNQELRRVLIEGLGYERIKAGIGASTIHKERNMELVQVAKSVDIEPIVLLKVECPSTLRPYVLRVPPSMKTCEQARRWTLWDDKQELEFLKET